MPFRSKLKQAFGRSGSTTETAATGGTTSAVSDAIAKRDKAAKKSRWHKTDQFKDWPEDVYKPHEIPQPKYKRPAAKEHTKNLEKFTWNTEGHADDRRNGSLGSQYSPMGSKLHSRRSSMEGPGGERLDEPSSAPIDGVDTVPATADTDDGGPLGKVETVRLTQVPTALPAAGEPPKVTAGAAESNKDAFDSADLSRALTAIKDGHTAAAVTA